MDILKSFHDLRVWQEAHAYVLEIYKTTKQFPSDEKFGLTSQLRRSAVSVASNIVEGFKRRGQDSVRFYTISEASLEESRYQVLLSKDLKYLPEEIFFNLEKRAIMIAKMLYKFKKTQF
ncbi:four helix bundle protein [Candidatus Gracilibacteria bacterium]|nr:four helix bundle protein [Candidatus Gracilibacteria bacterium]MCF7855956.1 four helix bundle protein [Candidatus Gracilibacteria bacterium]MCF7896351.1 four helix bundle protein [Candidatus Gracilibacteria bacterium]